VIIIFAVTKDQIPVYRELSKLIEGSTVGELAEDSSNIVELVKDNYDVRIQSSSLTHVSLLTVCRCMYIELVLLYLHTKGAFLQSYVNSAVN